MITCKHRTIAYLFMPLLMVSTAINALAEGNPEAKLRPLQPAPIDKNGVLILVRSTLIALEQANKTGNYTVFRDLASPQFQMNSPLQLGEIFYGLKKEGVDLSGSLIMEPQLINQPEINKSGMLHIAGYFPSISKKISFDLQYAPISGEWRLFSLKVSTGSALPVAPSLPTISPSSKNKIETSPESTAK